MVFDFEKASLPPVYIRNGKECYLDPIRKRLIYITPEETVRQKVISFLIESLDVPSEMIAVEEHLSHYGIESKRRADIIIHQTVDSEGSVVPIAVIECKASAVYLSEKEAYQMLDYCDLLKCDYAFLVNGLDVFCCKYDEETNEYIVIEEIPTYHQMLSGDYVKAVIGELPPRIPHEEIKDFLMKTRAEYESDKIWTDDISLQTPMEKAIPFFNLSACLLDTEIKMPKGEYGIFTLIEDYGIRILSYGDSSGGVFSGSYRSFLIEYKGNAEFVSFNVSNYCTYNKPDKIKTCLNIGIDTEDSSHHSLQLVLDDNVTVDGNRVKFYHHGRIAVGNIGSGKIDELRLFVESIYPQIVFGKKFYLGGLTNNRLWTLQDPEVINLVENLISYSLVRDEYRKYVKSNSKKG